MAYIECNDICFSYDNTKVVLNHVSLALESGKLTTLLGVNGAGKTTFLNCIMGLLRPQTGSVVLNGVDLKSMNRREIAKEIAYVPQISNPAFDYNVRDFVALGRSAHMGVFSTPSREDYVLVDKALEKLGMTSLSDRNFNELSGGERQIAYIARALVQQSKVIILDEPTAALDCKNQINVLKIIKELTDMNISVLQTSHNPDHCLMLGGQVAVLRSDGSLISGEYNDVLTSELLSEIYGTEMKLFYIPEINRKTCVPDMQI